MIKVTVSKLLRGTRENLYAVLTDYGNYHNWYPLKVRPKSRERISIRPFWPIYIQIQFQFKSDDRIVFHYVRGPFRGTSTWQLEVLDANKVQVNYSIKLKPVLFIYGWIAKTGMFRNKHFRDIKAIMNALEKEASNQ